MMNHDDVDGDDNLMSADGDGDALQYIVNTIQWMLLACICSNGGTSSALYISVTLKCVTISTAKNTATLIVVTW